jgi:orotate phosphoribosyltransferase
MKLNDSMSMQETNLRNLLKTGAFRFVDERTPWFPYTSGQVGAYYVQSTTVEKDGPAYAAAIQSLASLIRADAGAFDAISGGETRDWDFSNPVAVALRKPHLKLYKDGKALGADIAGKTFLHVADLNNEGSSVRDYWKPIIEQGGGRMAGVVAFVDRMEEGFALLKGLGLRLLSVVPLDERAWEIARATGHVNAALCAELVARRGDPAAWAEGALLKHPDYFRRFYRNPLTRPKAAKIINTYTRIRADLERIVKHHEN